MDQRQKAIVKSLFQVAWADGHVSAEESALLANFLPRLGLSMAEMICEMDAGLTENPEGEAPLEHLLPDHESRLAAMELLVRVSFSDGHLADAEVEYLGHLAVRLGIGSGELEQMRQRALQR